MARSPAASLRRGAIPAGPKPSEPPDNERSTRRSKNGLVPATAPKPPALATIPQSRLGLCSRPPTCHHKLQDEVLDIGDRPLGSKKPQSGHSLDHIEARDRLDLERIRLSPVSGDYSRLDGQSFPDPASDAKLKRDHVQSCRLHRAVF